MPTETSQIDNATDGSMSSEKSAAYICMNDPYDLLG